MLQEEGLAERLRAPRAPRRGDARARCAAGGSRSLCARPARVLAAADRGADAGGPRRRRVAADDPRALRHVARHRARQAGGQGVPHRPPRRLQRPDAGRHVERRGDGAAVRRRSAPGRRRAAALDVRSPRGVAPDLDQRSRRGGRHDAPPRTCHRRTSSCPAVPDVRHHLHRSRQRQHRGRRVRKELHLSNTQVGLVFSAFAYPYLRFPDHRRLGRRSVRRAARA